MTLFVHLLLSNKTLLYNYCCVGKNTASRCAIRAHPLLAPALNKARVRKLGLTSFVHPSLADRAPVS